MFAENFFADLALSAKLNSTKFDFFPLWEKRVKMDNKGQNGQNFVWKLLIREIKFRENFFP